MKNFRWQLLIILITGLIVGVLLLIQQDKTTETEDLTPSPVKGGIYSEALVGEFLRLNPFIDIYNQADKDVNKLIFNGLVKYAADGKPEPDLAETWGISGEGTVYTVSLRNDVKWHDGVKLTSADVLYTVSLLQSGSALIPEDLQNFWSEIQVEVLSDSLIEFSLPEAFSPFPDYLSFRILPEHLLGGLTLDDLIDHPYNLAPIGTGPYKFGNLLLEDNKINGVVLEANEDFYLGRPYLDEIVFMYYPDETAAWQAYKDGIVDGISEVDQSILDAALNDPNLNLYSARKPQMSLIYLNLDNDKVSFFQDPAFRRALLNAIDRQRIIDLVFKGQAIQAHGPIMPGSWAYYNDIEKIGYDPERAKSSLFSLGITLDNENSTLLTSEGQLIEFNLLIPDGDAYTTTGEMIKTDWEALGLKVEIMQLPYAEVINRLKNRDYEAALVDIDFTGSPDPDPYPFWGQAQMPIGQNYAQWNNRSASELLEQARINFDYGVRERLYRNFQVIFQEELPALPLYCPIYNYAVKAKIKDVSMGPFFDSSDRLNSIAEWYVLADTSTEDVINTAEPENSENN